MSEEDFDTKIDHINAAGFIIGEKSGLQSCSELLLERCGDLFARGRDAEASLLRELSKELKEKAKDRQEFYNRNILDKKQKAINELLAIRVENDKLRKKATQEEVSE